MSESPVPPRNSEQSQYLEAAVLDFSRLMTRRGNPAELVPKIRANLKKAGVDASALNLGGNRPAEEIEQMLNRRVLEASSKHKNSGSSSRKTR